MYVSLRSRLVSVTAYFGMRLDLSLKCNRCAAFKNTRFSSASCSEKWLACHDFEKKYKKNKKKKGDDRMSIY